MKKTIYCILLFIISLSCSAENKPQMYLASNGYIYEEQDKESKTCTYKSARVTTKGTNNIAKTYDLTFIYKKNKGFLKSPFLIIHIDTNIASRLDPSLNRFSLTGLQLDVPKKASQKTSVDFNKETKIGEATAISNKKLLKAIQDAIALNVELIYGDGQSNVEKHKEIATFTADDIAALKATIKLCEKKES
jgi:hypothetical protein